jgi:hypothetical protein
MQMIDPKRREDLARRVELRRRELLDRPDISKRTRELSQSSSRNPILQPHKRSLTRNFIIGGVAVFLMLACVVSATAAIAGNLWFQGEINDPTSAVIEQFYSSLKEQDYAGAYSHLSKSAKAALSQSAFADRYGSYDRVDGIVDSYTVTKRDVGATTATFTVAVQRRGDPNNAQLQIVRLVKEGSAWHIDSITPGGTVPISTATT